MLAARLTLLQSVAANVQGDWVDGGRLARQSMAELGPEWILDSFGRIGFNMVARDVALSERWHDDDDDVRRADFELVQDPIRRVSFEGVRALGEALAGHPLAALQTAGGVREFADVTNMAILGDELRLAELVARREVGDGDGVVEALEALAATDVGPDDLHPGPRPGRARGDPSRQRRHRRRADHAWTRCAARSIARCPERASAPWWRGARPTSRWRPTRSTTPSGGSARSMTRSGTTSAAPARGSCVSTTRRHASRWTTPFLGAVDTTSCSPCCDRWRRASTRRALKYATAAVETAVAHGMVQTVAAQGRVAVELVERCAWRAPAGWLDRVRRASVNTLAIGRDGRPVQAAGIEPLTDRERDVMRFLPSRLTLQEIANELYISMNTLKFHLKVIYRKLGVSSRAEAAEIARHDAQSD